MTAWVWFTQSLPAAARLMFRREATATTTNTPSTRTKHRRIRFSVVSINVRPGSRARPVSRLGRAARVWIRVRGVCLDDGHHCALHILLVGVGELRRKCPIGVERVRDDGGDVPEPLAR